MKDLADPDTDLESAPRVRVSTDVRALRLAAEEAQAAAEEAEAVAVEAKAIATAARARAHAGRLRRRAEAAAEVPAAEQTTDDPGADSAAHEPDSVTAIAPDETDSGTMESETAAEDRGVSRLGRWRARIAQAKPRHTALVAAALVLIIVSTGAGGYSLWQHHRVTEQDRRAAEFTAAARQGVIALTSLDFNHAKEDVQRVLDNSAGAFHDDFRGRAEDFTKVVQQSQVTTEGKVNASAVESMTDDTAVVLVAATSRITNSAGAQQEPRVWRLSVTVSRVSGQLKISKVEFVP
ncbi:hypothetical protein [Nocardia sp. GCM10030253]|uniref:hypothetical protein n=1 Tax=Nocardia sp. GCM10030253 TaxID=3273404 RepID=UPI00366F6387